MKPLLIVLGVGAVGYGCYRALRRLWPGDDKDPLALTDRHRHAAFAAGQPQRSHSDVRDAGPQSMRDAPQRSWTIVDEASDESFPASDPPGRY